MICHVHRMATTSGGNKSIQNTTAKYPEWYTWHEQNSHENKFYLFITSKNGSRLGQLEGRIDILKWAEALKVLATTHGLELVKHSEH